MSRWLFIVLLVMAGCAKPQSKMNRILKYAEAHHITDVQQFPIVLTVEIEDAPDLKTDVEGWLVSHGFQKGLGAAYNRDGKKVIQQYLYGDTFSIDVSEMMGGVALYGYGIRTPDQNAEPTLKRLLEYIESKYKLRRKELVSS